MSSSGEIRVWEMPKDAKTFEDALKSLRLATRPRPALAPGQGHF